MANLKQGDVVPTRGNMTTEISAVTQQNSDSNPSDAGPEQKSPTPCLIPTFADACKLVTAPYSCLVVDTHRRHIALSPMYLKKKKTGIQEQLNAELLKYSESLKGVPVAYDNIKVLGQQGDIYDDNGFIHMNIEASFVIFQPKRGQKLLGVINKVGVGHVGCLVHGCFNASIPKPQNVPLEVWSEANRVGTSLEFEVSQLDADVAGVLLIRGRLDKQRVQELTASGTTGSTESKEEAEAPCAEPLEGTKKKKKKNRSQEKEASEVSMVTDESGEVNGNTVDVNEHVKSKKKKKLQNGDSSTEIQGSDSSGYQSDKGSRKRKEAMGLDDDAEEPKTKRKKKD